MQALGIFSAPLHIFFFFFFFYTPFPSPALPTTAPSLLATRRPSSAPRRAAKLVGSRRCLDIAARPHLPLFFGFFERSRAPLRAKHSLIGPRATARSSAAVRGRRAGRAHRPADDRPGAPPGGHPGPSPCLDQRTVSSKNALPSQPEQASGSIAVRSSGLRHSAPRNISCRSLVITRASASELESRSPRYSKPVFFFFSISLNPRFFYLSLCESVRFSSPAANPRLPRGRSHRANHCRSLFFFLPQRAQLMPESSVV